jgi:rare lipoprotein A
MRLTANGDVFDKNAYTAAHKTLPFGTIVKVTNLKNNKTVTVKITDRGPFVEGRIIDLTPIAARDIEMLKHGVVPVEMEILSMPENKKPIRS